MVRIQGDQPFIDGGKDADEEVERMYEEYSDFMLALREGSAYSLSNVLGWCRRMISYRRYRTAYAKLKALSDAGEPRAMAMRGEMKMRGIGTIYDTKGAIHLYASAFRAGYIPASNLLFDQVSETGPYDTAFSLVRKASLAGCKSSMARLAIAFLEGKGTEKNASKAAFWFDKAVDSDEGFDRYMLFDAIWKLGGTASRRRMVSVVSSLSKEERDAKVRMGMAYQRGRGVAKDLPRAAALYRDAAMLGSSLGAIRFFDIVWNMRSADQYAHAAETVRRFADSGDSDSMWRLGKAYRFGKGVDRDFALAVELCEKALRRSLPDAGNELFEIWWDEATAESTERMRALATRHVSRGSGWAYGCLARMHLFGRGVDRDLSKAVKYARIAAEDKTAAAYETLLDVLREVNTEGVVKEMMSVISPRADEGEE